MKSISGLCKLSNDRKSSRQVGLAGCVACNFSSGKIALLKLLVLCRLDALFCPWNYNTGTMLRIPAMPAFHHNVLQAVHVAPSAASKNVVILQAHGLS